MIKVNETKCRIRRKKNRRTKGTFTRSFRFTKTLVSEGLPIVVNNLEEGQLINF